MFKQGNHLWQMLKRYKLFIIITTILGLAFFGLLLSERVQIPIGCPFKALTGIPCPGCGGTRALYAILHGDILEALYINPLSCVLIVFFAILPFWALYDGYTGKGILQKAFRMRLPKFCLVILFVVILANWIWNIIKQL